MARLVLTGTPGKLTKVRSKDVPDDLRDDYFGDPPGYCKVNAAGPLPPQEPPTLHLVGDWTKKDMTNASVVHCDLADWAPPGHKGERGNTGNHGIYLRFNANLDQMIAPEYIPFGEHEMIAAFLLQEAKQHSLGDDRRVMEESAAKLLSSYTQSWAPMRHAEPNMMKAARLAFRDHSEMLEWCERIMGDPRLIKGQSLDLGNGVVIDEAFLGSLNLQVPLHDRWEYERYLEEFIPKHLDAKNPISEQSIRVHVWRLLPLRFGWGIYDSPDWWIAEYGG